jgi:hypothetical protein
MMKEIPKKIQQSKEESDESESESDSASSGDDSDDSDDNVGGIPKGKLARRPVVKKRKSGGLKALFK